jgi:ethanolamine utilization protein EutN
VPAAKLEAFRGVAFLLVQPIDEACKPVSAPVVACDSIGANIGERVFMAQGREATTMLPDPFNPADMTIIAIIDEVTS